MSKPIASCKEFFIATETNQPTCHGIIVTITTLFFGVIGSLMGIMGLLCALNRLPTLSFFHPIGTIGFSGSLSFIVGSGLLLSLGLVTTIAIGCASKKKSSIPVEEEHSSMELSTIPFLTNATEISEIINIASCFLKEDEILVFTMNKEEKMTGAILSRYTSEKTDMIKWVDPNQLAELNNKSVSIKAIKERRSLALMPAKKLQDKLNANEGFYYKSAQTFIVRLPNPLEPSFTYFTAAEAKKETAENALKANGFTIVDLH